MDPLVDEEGAGVAESLWTVVAGEPLEVGVVEPLVRGQALKVHLILSCQYSVGTNDQFMRSRQDSAKTTE